MDEEISNLLLDISCDVETELLIQSKQNILDDRQKDRILESIVAVFQLNHRRYTDAIKKILSQELTNIVANNGK